MLQLVPVNPVSMKMMKNVKNVTVHVLLVISKNVSTVTIKNIELLQIVNVSKDGMMTKLSSVNLVNHNV